MPLTVLAIADEVDRLLYDHFRAERWQGIDLVLSCGDLPPDYLDFLCTSLSVPVFYVRGNHDASYQEPRYDGCVNLHGTIVTYQGVRLAGFEGCRRYNQGRYQYTEREMRGVVRRVKRQALRHGKPDIILTHAPPAGCHDGEDLCHRGFDCFTSAIEAWQPAYLVHGHTHAYYGQQKLSTVQQTSVINAFPYRVFEVALPETRKARLPAGPWCLPWRKTAEPLAGHGPPDAKTPPAVEAGGVRDALLG